MNAYVFKADIYCASCARELIRALDATTGKPPLELREDSDSWPQGPNENGGGEADSPQHCGACHTFLRNPLTDDGYKYVAEQIEMRAYHDGGNVSVLRQWAEFYKGENTFLDNAIQEWHSLKSEDWK